MSTKSPELFLSPDQRALLLAALNSNAPLNSQPRSSSDSLKNSQNTDTLTSPQNGEASFDTSLFTDADALADADYSFDLADYQLGDFGLESGTGDSPVNGNGNEHEKRKLSFDDQDEDEIDPHEAEPKRREGDDKTAKKPGRKPITNEPTSKRKAQNRAAQRAFRERKEKHLKDLELKVQDLEKVSESTNQENKALKEQVEKLQAELKEYRKRFSMGGGHSRSPSNSISQGLNSLDSAIRSSGGFNFDFPLFGNFAAPGQNVIGGKNTLDDSPNRGSNVSPTNYRVGPNGVLEIDRGTRNGLGSSVSPQSSNNNSPALRSNPNSFSNGIQQSPLQVHRVSIDEPRFNPSNDILSGLFSPTLIQAVNNDTTADYLTKGTSFSSSQSTPHMSSLFSFSDSPSASSVSQHSAKNGQNNSSSCGTTPEAMDVASPPSQNKTDSAPRLNSISEEGLVHASPLLDETQKNLLADNSFSWLAAQNGNTFDTSMFNDYRDPTTVSAGETAFNAAGMSYFDDAFPSAFDLTLPPTPPVISGEKTKPIAPGLNEDDDDEEEVVPADEPNSFLKCNQIWDKVQSHPKFASGEIDMDNLCSELRAKAKCSEKGVVVDKKDVDKILNKPIPSMWGL
ncbi:DNA-binding transcription factor yap1 [Orbilia oligospora]|uniref:DNA-binding transcription factor yap1 n=1 Tax=Orbilia oligospora TaxID=2813651 RepID=A0A7C8KS96_ORBOL|nr:DNA-binding transcription factor yap1, variant 2 [Orbilia oligospora]TGJ73861.1 DNA-binding transcription factor yap1 [Orbilia oligospora]